MTRGLTAGHERQRDTVKAQGGNGDPERILLAEVQEEC